MTHFSAWSKNLNFSKNEENCIMFFFNLLMQFFSRIFIVTPNSIIGYVILTSEVIWGQWRSRTVNWGHSGQNYKTTLRDAIFCMHTYMITSNNVGYVNLTSEVKGGHRRSKIRGHWKSKIAYWGHTLMKVLRDAIFFMYTLIISIDIWDCKTLTSEVIRCHWRSKTLK